MSELSEGRGDLGMGCGVGAGDLQWAVLTITIQRGNCDNLCGSEG